jgi:hypothetical protein
VRVASSAVYLNTFFLSNNKWDPAHFVTAASEWCLFIKKLNCGNCSDLQGILLKEPDVLSKITGSTLGLQVGNAGATGQANLAGIFLHTLYLVFIKFIKLISATASVVVAI